MAVRAISNLILHLFYNFALVYMKMHSFSAKQMRIIFFSRMLLMD